MKKILMTAKHLDAGGVETFITGIYPYIDKDEFQIDFVISMKDIHNDSKGYFEDDLVNQGAKVYRIAPKSKYLIRCFTDWNRLLKEHTEYEIVHINDGGGAAFPLAIAKKYGKKCIVHAHNSSSTLEKQNIIMKLFRKFVVKNAVLIACAKDAGKWMFGSKANVNVLHYGIDTEKFKFDVLNRNDIRKMYGIESDVPVIGHVGRFNIQKNHSFLIDIFYKICEKVPNAKLLLIGSGELEDKIKSKVITLGLEQNVIFVGNTKEVYKYLSAMDLYLFPSLFEGFGIAHIEAQCNGLPVILSNTLTSECLITDRAKMIDLKADSETWARCVLENLMNNDVKLRNQYCQEVCKKGFDRRTTASNLEKIYREI